MSQIPPPGQGPIDPRGAFSPVPPPPPQGAPGAPAGPPRGWMPPPMPPPMMPWGPPPYMPPPKGERSFSKAILVTLATTIFGLSLMANVYLLMISGFASGLGGGAQGRTSVIVDGDPVQKVALVPVTGIMMTDAAERFSKTLRQLEKDADLKAVVIEVNTPGGSVTASDQMHHAIVQFKASKKVPVIVSMTELGTSGGYYLACAADEIYAQPTTMTGNIGVLMPRYDLSQLADKHGIKDISMHSTGADYKTAGSMLKAETPEEHAYILALIDHAFAQFKDVVVKGRGNRLTQKIDVIANGKVYTAADAKTLGLVEDVMYRDDVLKRAGTMAGLSNMTVVKYEELPSLLSLFSGQSQLPSGGAKSGPNVTINGVNLSVDSSLLHELLTPRMMYLWRGD